MEDYKKKYEEALERAKSYQKWNKSAVITAIFPELKESEDGRIRKKALNYFKENQHEIETYHHVIVGDIIAWLEKQGQTFTKKDVDDAYLKGVCDTKQELEKQGENKPTDKVEPKFKVGDWITFTRKDGTREVLQISDVIDGRYYFNHLLHFSWSVKECNEKCHLWTIDDAKPGDVLTANDCRPFIFKDFSDTKHSNNPTAYCGVDTLNIFTTGLDNFWWTDEEVYPATKEQCDLLFQKMKEAGYEWNAEQKELKKFGQISALREEDENRIKDIIYFLDTAKKHYASTVELDNCIDWLKSLKERIIK